MQIDLFSTPAALQKHFTIYRSSAGSGKTYTLTREYLTLALQSPQYFRSILAVTFTNKATQEMKTRIVETLHQLSNGLKGGIQKELVQSTGLTEVQLEKQAQDVLSAILHDYSSFAVSTIDSFFQTVIRSFAKEVGLQAGFKVELEQEKVLDELIDLLLKDVGHDKYLREWLTQYAADRVDEGHTWDIRQDIKNLAGEIFKEDFKLHEKKLQKIAEDPQHFLHFLHMLKELRVAFEDRMQKIGEEAMELMERFGLEVADFSYGPSGVGGYFLNLLPEKKKYEAGSRALTALDDPEKWYSKSSKKKEAIEAAVSAGLNELLGRAITLYEEEHQKYVTAQQVLRFVYSFGILAKLTDKLRYYREEHDMMLISDAAVFLRDIIGENEAPFIYEKTGSNYQHFLIDEFQDTSGFQWQNFKPLVANSVAAGNYNLVVGDTKQSIYRWRGGDWQLLLNQIELDIGAQQTKTVELNYNWRSCREIIAFNNQLFFQSATALKQLYLEQIATINNDAERSTLEFEAENIAEAYKDVFQHFPEGKTATARCGYINIQFLENIREDEGEEEDEGGDWKSQARQNMLRTIEQLQDKGYRLKDIALLVRTKGDGKALADALMEAEENKATDSPYSYQVVSNESLFLDSAASVGLLLNILRYMNNSNDTVARANMVYDYQMYILGNKEQDLHSIFRSASQKEKSYEQYLPDHFIEKRPYLNKLPLYELVETLILEFDLHKIKSEWAYMQAFQDAVLNFAKNERGDILSFLEWWAESGQKISVQLSQSLDAIRIYTVHTSKGLQFKAVLIPYCNWKLDHNTQFNNFIWSETEEKPFHKLEVLPVKYTARLKESIFRQDYYRELMKAYLDNLNLLYVAFTRAEESLFACAPLPSFDKKTGTAKATEINGLLYRLLEGKALPAAEGGSAKESGLTLSAHWNPDQHSFTLGKLEQAKYKEEKSDISQIELRHYFTQRWRKRLAVRKRSGELSYAKTTGDAAIINWNQTIHAILAKIKTAGDLNHVLQEVYFEGLISKEEQPVISEKLQRLFKHPVAGHWFSNNWMVRTELPILASGGFVTQPDRVITQDKTAIVIDFKTEAPPEGRNDEKSIHIYKSLLKRMGYQQIEGYLFYLDEEKAIQI